MSTDKVHGVFLVVVGFSEIDFVNFFVEPGGFVDQVKNGENEESKSDEAEAKDLATSESSHETSTEILDSTLDPVGSDGNILGFLGIIRIRVEEFVEIVDVSVVEVLLWDGVLEFLSEAAIVGGSGIGVNGNFHTNVTSSNGGQSTNEEGNSGVREV